MRVDEEQLRAGMLENIRRVVERLRRIDRNDDASGKERREIADDPVDAVVRDERDAIARGQARVADRAGDVLDALEQSRARRGRPHPSTRSTDFVARLRERAPNQVRKRLFRRKLRGHHDATPMRAARAGVPF